MGTERPTEAQVRQKSLLSRTAKTVRNTTPTNLLCFIYIANLVSAIGVIAVGISKFMNLFSSETTDGKLSIFIVAFCCIVFGLGLLFVEFPLLKNQDKVKLFLGSYFGFVYTHRGKAVFVFFLATLCLSTSSEKVSGFVFSLFIGFLIMLNSLCTCFIFYVHPTFHEVEMFPAQMDHKKPDAQYPSFGLESGSKSPTTGGGAFPETLNGDSYRFGATMSSTYPTTDYAESPFAIEESDNEFTDFAVTETSPTQQVGKT